MNEGMKLGAGTVTWAFNGDSLETSLREIAELGIKRVDVIGMLHGDPEALSASTLAAAREILDGEGMIASSVLAVKAGANIATNDPTRSAACQEYFKGILDICAALGSKEICFMGGHYEIECPREKSWANAVSFSRWIAEECAAAGVYATYELEWRTCGIVRSVSEMARMIEEVAMDGVYANIDVGHAGLVRDGMEAMQAVGGKTIHLHLNDNDTEIHTNALPGDGAVPIIEYVDALIAGGMFDLAAALGHEVTAGIEVEDVGLTGAPPQELVAQSRDWILANLPLTTL